MAASSSEATTNTQPQPAAAVGQQPQFQPAVLEARAKAEEYCKSLLIINYYLKCLIIITNINQRQ